MMNNTSADSNIESVVMRRVHAVHTLRPLVSATALAFLVSVLALWGIGREVWVAHVFQNAPSIANLSASARFWLAAFLNTRLIVQVLCVATLAGTVYLARETAQLIGNVLAPARA